MRNPYLDDREDDDINKLRREALLDEMAPAQPRPRDRTRPSTPEPVDYPGQQPGVSRPHAAPAPEPWREPASRVDPRRQLEPASSTNPYSSTTITDYAPAPAPMTRERERAPSGRQPFDYDPRDDVSTPYRVDVDPRREGDGLAETTNPRRPQPSTSPTPRPSSPSADATGAVSRYAFTPQQRTGGAPGTSYFDSLLNTDVDATRPVTMYGGGKLAPKAENLTLEMRSRIEQNAGLDLNGLAQEDIDHLVETGWIYGNPAPPGYSYNDEGLLRKNGSVLKTIGRIAAIAAPVIATIATGGAASPWLMATIGAGAGAANAYLAGGDTSDILTGMALGGIGGGVAGAGGGILPRAGVGALGPALTGGDASDILTGAGIGGGLAAVDPNVGIPTRPSTTDLVVNTALEGVSAALGSPGTGGPIDPMSLDPLIDGTGAPPRHPPTTPGPAQPPASGAPPRHGETEPTREERIEEITRVQEWIADNDARRAQGLPERSFEEFLALPAAPATSTTPATSGPAPFAMEGFNLTRAQDPSFSVKDAFAAAVRQPGIPPPPGENKAALGEWFAQHVAPSIEAQGHTVNWIDGDKVNITGPQGTGTIDWFRGAGAPGGALAWQPDDGGGGGGAAASGAMNVQDAYAYLKSIAHPGMSRAEMERAVTAAFGNVPGFEKAYAGDVVINGRKIDLITNFEGANPQWSDNLSFQPLHPGGSMARGGGGNGGLNLAPGVSLAAPLGNSNVLQDILAEIQRIQRGEAPRDALLSELRG